MKKNDTIAMMLFQAWAAWDWFAWGVRSLVRGRGPL